MAHCPVAESIYAVISPFDFVNRTETNELALNIIAITGISNTYLVKAISIAIRYSASRLQFKDEGSVDELPVLEYQSQQYRLLPHLAAAIIQKVFCVWFAVEFSEFSKSLFTGEIVPHVGTEIHALSSAAKPICTWAVRDAIQECREATGGHGYLKGTTRSQTEPKFYTSMFHMSK